jgi:hypothetical protein
MYEVRGNLESLIGVIAIAKTNGADQRSIQEDLNCMRTQAGALDADGEPEGGMLGRVQILNIERLCEGFLEKPLSHKVLSGTHRIPKEVLSLRSLNRVGKLGSGLAAVTEGRRMVWIR